MLRWVCRAAVLLLPGCFNPHYVDVRCGTDGVCPGGVACNRAGFCEIPPSLSCAPDGACPAGQECSADGFCKAPGSGGDAGIGPGIDASPTIDALASTCKVLPSFKTNAQPSLRDIVAGAAQSCAGCHAGSVAGATAAMDLTYIASTDDAKILLVCDEVRSRINFQTTDQSGLYLAPNPASSTNHPFKLTAAQFTTFKTAVDMWVKAEVMAP